MKKSKNSSVRMFKSVKMLTLAAMLAAISVVIGIVCNNYLSFGAIRITFVGLPIIISGIIFGPVVGGFVGFVSDVVGYCYSMQAFAINPVISIAAALLGIIPGIIVKYIVKKRNAFSEVG